MLPNVAPEAGDDALATPLDTALVIDVATDLLANDGDDNGDSVTFVSVIDNPATPQTHLHHGRRRRQRLGCDGGG